MYPPMSLSYSLFPPGDGPGRERIEEEKEELFKHRKNSERELLIMTAVLVLELDYIACPKGIKI